MAWSVANVCFWKRLGTASQYTEKQQCHVQCRRYVLMCSVHLQPVYTLAVTDLLHRPVS